MLNQQQDPSHRASHIDGLAGSESRRDGGRDDPICARIGVSVPRQMPLRIDGNDDVRHTGSVEDAPPKLLFRRRLNADLRNNDKRNRVSLPGKRPDRTKNTARHPNASIHGCVTPIGNDESGQRQEMRSTRSRMPGQFRVEVRPIVVEVAAEQRGHEERHHSNWSLK